MHVKGDYARRCVETGIQLLVESQCGRIQKFGKKQWPVGENGAEGLEDNSIYSTERGLQKCRYVMIQFLQLVARACLGSRQLPHCQFSRATQRLIIFKIQRHLGSPALYIFSKFEQSVGVQLIISPILLINVNFQEMRYEAHSKPHLVSFKLFNLVF